MPLLIDVAAALIIARAVFPLFADFVHESEQPLRHREFGKPH